MAVDFPRIYIAGRSMGSPTTHKIIVHNITRHLFLRPLPPRQPPVGEELENEGMAVARRLLGGHHTKANITAGSGRAFPKGHGEPPQNGPEEEWSITINIKYGHSARTLRLAPEDSATNKWDLWGGDGSGTKFLFDAYVEGGWRIPGWLRLPAPPGGRDRPYEPHQVQPWPDSSDQLPEWNNTLGGMPLRVALMSLVRHPVNLEARP